MAFMSRALAKLELADLGIQLITKDALVLLVCVCVCVIYLLVITITSKKGRLVIGRGIES